MPDIEELSGFGNMERFIKLAEGQVKYVPSWGWMTWDGQRWAFDIANRVQEIAKEAHARIWNELALTEEKGMQAKIKMWAMKSASNGQVKATLSLAQSSPKLIDYTENFDKDPLLFNVQNGTLDLRTGELKPHDPKDKITKLAPILYNKTATCPIWEKFILRVMGDNKVFTRFLQRAIGYSLTGLTIEEVFFLLYGTGGNGKSKMLELVLALLGDYGKAASPNTFLEKQVGSEGPRNDIAALVGTRFVKAVEPDKDKKLAESLVKEITGGDAVTARFLHREEFTFTPQLKLWLAANHKPKVKSQDNGIWRRVIFIPFEIQIPDEERDKNLIDKLKAELPGVLNWVIEGCREWQQIGLKIPEAFRESIDEYKRENDPLAEWLGQNYSKGKAEETMPLNELYKKYKAYALENEDAPLGKRNFSVSLQERGYTVRNGSGNVTTVYGIKSCSDSAIPKRNGATPQDSFDRELEEVYAASWPSEN